RECESDDVLLERALNRVHAGDGRNWTGFRLAEALRDNRHPKRVAENTLRDFVRSCPPDDHEYTESEALASVESAYGREAGKPTGRFVGDKTDAGGAEGSVGPPKPAAKITSGPAAAEFDAGIDRDQSKVDCPHCMTLVLRKGTETPYVGFARCKRNVCRACRRANGMGFLMRMEEGIRNDLRAGLLLATFVGTASNDAMKHRRRSLKNYGEFRHDGVRRGVATLPRDVPLPCGFVLTTAEDVAGLMQTMQALAEMAEDESENPFASVKRVRPFDTSRGWTEKGLEASRTFSLIEEGDQKPYQRK